MRTTYHFVRQGPGRFGLYKVVEAAGISFVTAIAMQPISFHDRELQGDPAKEEGES